MASREQERNERSLLRRQEVLALPVVPLRQHGWLTPSATDPQWRREPEGIGVGPDGAALAVWRSLGRPESALITSHFGNRVVAAARELTTASTRPLFFVQPLPDDRVLTAAARTKGEANGHVWDGAGSLVCQADLGDAIEDAISDEAGEVWVGYFDEALGSPPPAGHRLARFSSDLVLDWMYPSPGSTSLPPVDDCYALNVVARSAYCCPYSDFQLLRVHGSAVENYGPMPYRGAHALLIDGSIGAMVGGYGPDYDLVSPFRIAASGIEHHLSPLRLVLPDGLEVRDRRIFCRGAQLHVFVRSGWYRLDLDDFLRAAT